MTEGFCERLREASEPLWGGLLEHPFIAQLADGTLPLDRFRFYLEQDRLYLLDFARVLALAAARSRDETELRWFTAALRQTLEEELVENERLHQLAVIEGAPDRGGSVELGPAAGAYTGFLNEVGFRGSSLELTVALLPCPWSYAEIGRTYGGRVADHPIFTDWFAYQSSPEAQAFAEQMVALVDSRATRLDEGEFDSLAAVFRAATRHELAFWDASYTLTQWAQPTE
ncbi:MAG: thiaminase II [Solirubrobacterales bacterium]|nr:thiaminase II [Solirubrobacterales bacterium]